MLDSFGVISMPSDAFVLCWISFSSLNSLVRDVIPPPFSLSLSLSAALQTYSVLTIRFYTYFTSIYLVEKSY